MSLHAKLSDPRAFVTFYGTTPPRATTPNDRVVTAATRLAARAQRLQPDALVVYDVQDESSRTPIPRPFPFLPTIEARVYGRLLQELTKLPVVSYKCIAEMTEERLADWLDETGRDYGLRFLSLVGLASSRGRHSAMSLARATQLAAAHEGGFTLGGVAIAERHTPERSESQRLLQKAADGCQFFISQCVYHVEPTIRLLADYARDCRERGVAPRRIVLTFTPCGRPQTMAFMKWLGIAISDETERAILDDPAPLSKSIQICCTHLQTILDQDFAAELPLGFNVESVSINKEEIEASVELFQALRDVVQAHGR